MKKETKQEEQKQEAVKEEAKEIPVENKGEKSVEIPFVQKKDTPRTPVEAVANYVSKQVSSIVFGVLSPKLIKKMASAKIVTPELYDKEGYPVDGGLMDIRLGVIDPGLKCKTCGSKL